MIAELNDGSVLTADMGNMSYLRLTDDSGAYLTDDSGDYITDDLNNYI